MATEVSMPQDLLIPPNLPEDHPFILYKKDLLPLGPLTASLHTWENEDLADQVFELVVRPQQAQFWANEFNVRHQPDADDSIPGDPYEAVAMELWGTRKQASEPIFADLKPGSNILVVNPGGGIGSQERVVAQMAAENNVQIGLVLIDNNSAATDQAQINFDALKEQHPETVIHTQVVHGDMAITSDVLSQAIETSRKPNEVVIMLVYSQYSPLNRYKQQLDAYFAAGDQLGVPVKVIEVSLDPTFDRTKLRDKLNNLIQAFKEGKLPEEMQSKVAKFLRYYERIGQHGERVAKHMPVWPPAEVTNYLEENGYSKTEGFIISDAPILEGQANLRVITKA